MPGWLAHRAHVLPSAVAVADGERALTYLELDAWVGHAAAELGWHGVGHGDRVALLCPNSLEFAVAVHAASRAGAVLVPLNLRLTAEEQAWQVAHSGSRLVLCHESLLRAAAGLGAHA